MLVMLMMILRGNASRGLNSLFIHLFAKGISNSPPQLAYSDSAEYQRLADPLPQLGFQLGTLKVGNQSLKVSFFAPQPSPHRHILVLF